ncbi:sirohydrochlorin chelatase [Actinomadura macrotermitis]|uniref:Sirohydrochlorin ferrochelatase n=1 Tax=Actinomadura macrotermitis TaxID=2585200 RepID=A0A7K0C6F9_9ACTN|nr:Sirohydrochlorin ferrochelatase [Actinomadura macrotermitis]
MAERGAGQAPALVAVAHGSRDPRAAASTRELLRRVRALRPWVTVAEAYAELAEPSLEEAVRAVDGPLVSVPLLLARGYHALIDIPGRVERLRPDAAAGRPLGPHALLAEALADRLAEIPALGRGDAVVLGAAGSSDPAGLADVRVAARLLSRRLRRPVPFGFVAAGGPPLAEVVAERRAAGAARVVVASYLLAPGHFQDRLEGAGADHVTRPLGAHDALARLVLRRYDQARLRMAPVVPVA